MILAGLGPVAAGVTGGGQPTRAFTQHQLLELTPHWLLSVAWNACAVLSLRHGCAQRVCTVLQAGMHAQAMHAVWQLCLVCMCASGCGGWACNVMQHAALQSSSMHARSGWYLVAGVSLALRRVKEHARRRLDASPAANCRLRAKHLRLPLGA